MTTEAPKITAGEWVVSYPAEIMVCDKDGITLEMSDLASSSMSRRAARR